MLFENGQPKLMPADSNRTQGSGHRSGTTGGSSLPPARPAG